MNTLHAANFSDRILSWYWQGHQQCYLQRCNHNDHSNKWQYWDSKAASSEPCVQKSTTKWQQVKPILSRGRFINFIIFIQLVTSPFPLVEILLNFVSKLTNRATSRCFTVMVSEKKFFFLFNLTVDYLF